MEMNVQLPTIDCPIEWCSGNRNEHGGFGDPPEEWLHTDGAGTDVGHGAVLYRSRLGSGPDKWQVAIGDVMCAGAESPAQIAQIFGDISRRIDQAEGVSGDALH